MCSSPCNSAVEIQHEIFMNLFISKQTNKILHLDLKTKKKLQLSKVWYINFEFNIYSKKIRTKWCVKWFIWLIWLECEVFFLSPVIILLYTKYFKFDLTKLQISSSILISFHCQFFFVFGKTISDCQSIKNIQSKFVTEVYNGIKN